MASARSGQHIQPADQQAVALDLGEPERRALLGMPVDPFLLGPDINKGKHVRIGQQRGAAAQFRQELTVGLVQLQHFPR